MSDLQTAAAIETAVEQTVTEARVAKFTRDDDGSLVVSIVVSDDNNAAPAKTDDGASLQEIAEEQPTAVEEQEEPVTREVSDGKCGAETAKGTPCKLPADRCPHHGDASSDSSANSDDGPEGRGGYITSYGPCIAANGKDTQEPCGFGANDDDTSFCNRHKKMDEPALSTPAVRAREAWKDGDLDALNSFIKEYVE